jgi:hypothetical protein
MFVLRELFNFKCDKETNFRASLINSDFYAHKTGYDEEIKMYILDTISLTMYKNLRSEILIEKSMVDQVVNNPQHVGTKISPMVSVHSQILPKISKLFIILAPSCNFAAKILHAFLIYSSVLHARQ